MTTTLEHTYKPRGSAKALFGCKNSEVLLSGPAGTGKSRAALEKLHYMALLNKGMRGLIIRKTAASLGSTALVTWREHVAKESLESGVVVFYGGGREEPAQYRFSNGSTINIGGMDKATKIMSSEYDVIYVQEAIELTLNDWESLTTRLRNGKVSFQQIVADTNPDRPTHWLKQRCDEGTTQLFYSKHEENPLYFDDAGGLTEVGKSYIAKLDNLTGVRKQRLRHGKWVAAEGLIYETFDPSIHLVDVEVKPEWSRIWSVDFGYTNPFVLQCWAEDDDGRLYLYRELYVSQKLVEDSAKIILSIVAPGGNWIEPKPRAIVCDHDAEDRATLERHLGFSTDPARKNVSEGIQAVASRLRPAGDGKPRLFIKAGCTVNRDPLLDDLKKPTSTLEELPGYVWDISEGKQPKEQPIKEDDHGCDALRYAVAYRDLAPTPRIRWL